MSEREKLNENKEQLAKEACMKNVKRNIKIRCVGKMQREKLSRNWNL